MPGTSSLEFVQSLSHQPAHHPRPRGPGADPGAVPATSPGAEATIAELARLPKAGERAARPARQACWPGRARTTRPSAELDRLIAAFPDRSVQQREARLAKAESLVGLKKFKEAEALVRAGHPGRARRGRPAQAAAYNTLGDCLRAANRPKDALLAYLHTDLLYSKDKEEHPRASSRSRSSSASSSRTAGPTNTPSGSGRSIPAASGYRPSEATAGVAVRFKCARLGIAR